jgi:alpha-1,4-digalacturonate transport system permease protein
LNTAFIHAFRNLSNGVLALFERAMDILEHALLIPLQNWLGKPHRMAYFFVLPNLLVFGVFILLPMMLNFVYGFTRGQTILLENREFVGLENMQRLFTCDDYANYRTCQEDLFWRSASNTVIFVVIEVILIVLMALMTAVALNHKIRGRGFFRSVFFYPVLLSPVVVALIWKWILQEQNGVLNSLIVALGGEKVPFLVNVNWATFWAIVVSVWAQMGFYTLILLAGLQSIPRDLYESSAMDGANVLNRFRFITLPLLMPTMTVVLVLSVIRAVQVFDVVYVLTGGGPGTATQYIVQYIYKTAFERREYGIAASASLVLAFVLVMFTIIQLRAQRTTRQSQES